MGVAARVDRYQRRRRWVGFPLAVLYKYADDQGAYLAALITYYGFLSLFPLLLLLVTIAGYLLHGDPALQQRVLHSAVNQFPVVGPRIGKQVQAAHGSLLAVVIGVLGSIYGGIGVAQATQNAMNTAWAIPRNSRPNPIKSRLRSLLLLALLGLGVLLTTALSALTTGAHALLGDVIGGVGVRVGATALAVAMNVALFVVAFRLLTARKINVADIRGGAVAAAVGWQALQTAGTYLISHELRRASASYGVFGVVLGLIVFLYLAAVMVVLCAEANVVRARGLWPRSLLTPFTDDVALTDADRRAYTSYAAAQRNKGFETIHVDFRPDAAGGSPGRSPDGDDTSGPGPSSP